MIVVLGAAVILLVLVIGLILDGPIHYDQEE